MTVTCRPTQARAANARTAGAAQLKSSTHRGGEPPLARGPSRRSSKCARVRPPRGAPRSDTRSQGHRRCRAATIAAAGPLPAARSGRARTRRRRCRRGAATSHERSAQRSERAWHVRLCARRFARRLGHDTCGVHVMHVSTHTEYVPVCTWRNAEDPWWRSEHQRPACATRLVNRNYPAAIRA